MAMPKMRQSGGGGGTALGAMAMRRFQAAQAAQSATSPQAAVGRAISAARLPYLGGQSLVNSLRNDPTSIAHVNAPIDTTVPSGGATPAQMAAQAAQAAQSGGGGDGSAAAPPPADGSQGDGIDGTQPQQQGWTDGGEDAAVDPDAQQPPPEEPDNIRVVEYDHDNPDGIPTDGGEDYAVNQPPPDAQTDYIAGEVQTPSPFPLVASHIRDGELRTYALLQTPHGCMPLTNCVRLPESVKVRDGYVSFGVDYGNFGLDATIKQSKRLLMKRAEKEKVRLECESLVRRARQGDQNAMAMMTQVKENAKKGDPRARFSMVCLQQYISRNPVGDATQFGEEKPNDKALSFWSTVALANGAPLRTERIIGLAASFPKDAHKDIFLNGVTFFKNPQRLADMARHLDPQEKNILDIGRAVGEARALQRVRRGAPLRTLDANMGWEMGE